jgi:predicted CXXCH cytochrome family protein
MKRSIIVCLAIGLVLSLGTVAMAGLAAGTGIKATSHDLSGIGGRSTSFGDATEQGLQDRICVYCHAPHNTLATDAIFDYMPLWNHAKSTNTIFTTYTNGVNVPDNQQHNSTAAEIAGNPGGVSMLCLSCHDGSVATNTYGKVTGTKKFVAGDRAAIGLGGDLSNHHPIGFNYDSVSALDNEIRVSTVGIPQGGTVGVKAGGPTTIGELMVNGNMECVSCHDVHNTKNGGSKFTWIEDNQSALCLTCHAKDGTAQTDPFVP